MKGSRLHHSSFSLRSPAHICSPSRLASLPSFDLDCSVLRDVFAPPGCSYRAGQQVAVPAPPLRARLVRLSHVAFTALWEIEASTGEVKNARCGVTCHKDSTQQPSYLGSLLILLWLEPMVKEPYVVFISLILFINTVFIQCNDCKKATMPL